MHTQEEIPAAEAPGRRWPWLYVLATAAATVLFAAYILVQHALQGSSTPWSRALLWAFPAAVLWALLYLPIARLARRLTPERVGWPRTLLAQGALAAVFAAAYVVLRSAVDLLFPIFSHWGSGLGEVLRYHTRHSLGGALVLYAPASALGYAVEYRRWYRRLHERSLGLERHLAELRAAPPPPAEEAPPGGAPTFVVRTPTRTFTVAADEVDWFEAERNYVALHVGERTHLVRETMRGVEEKLDPARFVRVHRSVILNVGRVSELRVSPAGEWLAVLRGGAELRTSQSGRARLLEVLDGRA